MNENNLSGSPLKKKVFIPLLLVWNILLLYDFINGSFPFGVTTSIALSLLLLFGVLLFISEDFRIAILKPGRELKNYKKLSISIIIISAFIIISLSLFFYLNEPKGTF